MLDDASRVLAVASMLIASRSDVPGEFDGDPEYFKRVAYLNSEPDFKPLIQHGFIEVLADASKTERMLADARPEERRGETETETEREESASAPPSPSKFPPENFKPDEFTLKNLKARRPDLDMDSMLELFLTMEYQYPRTDWDRAFSKLVLTQRAGPSAKDDDDAIARWARGDIPDEFREVQ
jgi:hypothetical protein